MHKTRIISGVVGVAILLAIIYFGNISLTIGIFLAAVIGVYEFYHAMGNAGYKPFKIIGYLSCLYILILGLNNQFNIIGEKLSFDKFISLTALSFFVLLAVLFSIVIITQNKFNIVDVAITAFGVFYVVFLFSFVVLTWNLKNGNLYIWLIFIGAFATDTFAYVAGVIFGKTKFLPVISPNKSVEGSVGGIVGCIVITVIYGLFIDRYIGNTPIYHYVILGVLNGILSQIGDWTASAIKRYVKVKDYGKIMPGHGGILDRFDSVLFTAPVVFFYITLM